MSSVLRSHAPYNTNFFCFVLFCSVLHLFFRPLVFRCHIFCLIHTAILFKISNPNIFFRTKTLSEINKQKKIVYKILGWSVSIDSRRCFFHGCAINNDSLETIEATAFGTYEIDLFGRLYICNRNITMATAYCRFDGWHTMRHRSNHHNGSILKYYN